MLLSLNPHSITQAQLVTEATEAMAAWQAEPRNRQLCRHALTKMDEDAYSPVTAALIQPVLAHVEQHSFQLNTYELISLASVLIANANWKKLTNTEAAQRQLVAFLLAATHTNASPPTQELAWEIINAWQQSAGRAAVSVNAGSVSSEVLLGQAWAALYAGDLTEHYLKNLALLKTLEAIPLFCQKQPPVRTTSVLPGDLTP